MGILNTSQNVLMWMQKSPQDDGECRRRTLNIRPALRLLPFKPRQFSKQHSFEMPCSSIGSETPDPLETSAVYPYCPDDEVREYNRFLYGVRREQKHLKFIKTSNSICVGDTSAQSALTQSVDKIFKCSWPDVLQEEDLQILDPPAFLKKYAWSMENMYLDAADNKAVYEFYRFQTDHQSSGVSASFEAVRRLRHALCSTFDVVQSSGPPWTAVYNSLMESVWHDDLQDAQVSVSFRPRWSLYPSKTGTPGEWPAIVPDVVFSAMVPISDSRRLLEARQYHPAYAFSDQATQDSILEIPILIVEYDKVDLDLRPVKSEVHRKHLEAAIAAALPMHKVLGLRTPIYGLFIDRYTADSCAGTLAEVNGITMPAIHDIVIHPGQRVDFFHRSLHVLHLRNIIANLGESARSILEDNKNDTFTDLRPYIEFQDQENFRCPSNRRVIDTKRPPLVVEDDALQSIFSLDLDDVTRWLSRGHISVTEKNETTVELPKEIRDWMCLFAEPERFPDAWIREVVADSIKGLSDRAQDLVPTFLSRYPYSSTSRDTLLSDSLKASLSCDVWASLTVCSHASDLHKAPANGLNPHSASSHWSTIYDSLFLRAKQKSQNPCILFDTYPQWNPHRNLRSFSNGTEKHLLDEIRPSCAYSYQVGEDHIIMRKFPRDVEGVEYLNPEFTVQSLVNELSGGFIVNIPVMVGEYVLVPGDSDERAKHLSHLAMTMRSALALWEIHCLKGPVIGFLMECNIVETKLGWIDDDGKCIIRDVPECRFDLLDPYESFRLFHFLKVYSSKPFWDNLDQKVDTHAMTAIERLLDPSYRTWREDV
ncbi:hypothetical protein BDZ89DRAFT_1074852 [Hymenopellis radicata]|nr:hypothetical protein BDZ89DRAFT_1074852 [Hymenopellis radicata]